MSDRLPVADDAPTPKPDHRMWLNAFNCINPSDDFALFVGRDVIRLLMDSEPPPRGSGGPYRTTTIEVRCS